MATLTEYTTPGTYTWTAPSNGTVDVVAYGCGAVASKRFGFVTFPKPAHLFPKERTADTKGVTTLG